MDRKSSYKVPEDITKFHCQDCNLTIHENDRENHLNGSRHKYKVRQKKNESQKRTEKFACDICKTKFTDFDFYTVHMGSKTHKRNVRRRKKLGGYNRISRSPEIGISTVTDFKVVPKARRATVHSVSTLEDIQDTITDYKSIREKYRIRNASHQAGQSKTYAVSVTAFWAISLALDSTVEDFKISVNDKAWGDFGDVVIEIGYKETVDQPATTSTFAVQFKQISGNDKTIESLNEGKYSLANFIAQVGKINRPGNGANEKFVIFTTASTSSSLRQSFAIKSDAIHKTIADCPCNKEMKEISVVARTLSNRRKHLMNTSDDNENIFFFFSTDNVHVVPKLYLYTRQKKVKNYAKAIDTAINEKLEHGKVEIHRDFIKYIEYWSDGFLGGNYVLKKEDVLVKLGELLLSEFRERPQAEISNPVSYKIWNQAVNSVDVTVLLKTPFIIFKICRPINLRIETELGLTIDTSSCTLQLTQASISKIQNQVLKMYLFEETLGDIQDEIPLEIVYDIFWKAGMSPMILRVKDEKDQYHILEVIGLLKTFGLTRRYFLITPVQVNRTILKVYKSITYFTNLDEVARKIHPSFLDQITITVTDGFSISLKTIQKSDQYFQKAITANEFFDLSLGTFRFKSINNYLTKREPGAEDIKLVLEDTLMVKLKKEIDMKSENGDSLDEKLNEGNKSLRGLHPSIFY